MRVLILGASGMLGHRLWLACRDRHDTVAALRALPPGPAADLFDPRRTDLGTDLTSDAALDDLFRRTRPEAVLNAAGLVKQRADGQDPLAALALNALLPHRLALRCRAAGARLVHVSTDCVFSGRRGASTEADLPDPPDVYGRSKLLGEVDDGHALTLRTSIVGRELAGERGLLEWLLARRGGRVAGFRHARFSGLTTPALADTVVALLEEHPSLTGLRHVAGEPVSKLDLLLLARDAFALPLAVDPADEPVIDRTLDDARFRAETGIPKPGWPAMLAALAADPVPYDRLRSTP